ncbi:glycoside hydrolase family 15 protein [Gordonia sp. VNQ95]|uniref:glycoside hydrolase family 15 protein n=1 Tax=Gordonia sp. VNQ95 TaxID=3156619 RepID=UPI0032B4B695
MAAYIEDYALVGDCRTAALISIGGDIDWLSVPRYDSPSIFGALLGTEEHGSWRLAPTDRDARATRRYDGDSMILVTRWETTGGIAEVHEFMPIDGERVDVIRRVVGVEGSVEFGTELRMRFDYARTVPWVLQAGDDDEPALRGIAGPDAVVVRGVALHAEDHVHRGTLTTRPGSTDDLVMTWQRSYRPDPDPLDVDAALRETREWWSHWAGRIDHDGPYRDQVVRSLVVLRALSNLDTGGIVAAATTSLPEQIGGGRNWDYRYVWLRDAALTLDVLVCHGFLHVAEHWRKWLMRAIAGDPTQLQIMYGIAGERDLPERELTHLPGYEGSSPVRIGNAAVSQYQADTIGEVLVALESARDSGLEETSMSWSLQRELLYQVEANIDRLDQGIWEMRGEARRFTHSRAMVWAALDRGVRAIRAHGLEGPLDRWERLRDKVAHEIDTTLVDPDTGAFVQYEGTTEVDAALLQLPQVGFCEPDDRRILATVKRIEQTLMVGGLVTRYRTDAGVDGIDGGEHPFMACTFWLVEQYARSGRIEDAHDLMKRACATANDVGLFSEEYDTDARRQTGNIPQALSHLAFVRAADALAGTSADG